jgi:hypothetical protein
MPPHGFPFPDWCSPPRRFCSLSRTEHASEHPEPILEQYVSSVDTPDLPTEGFDLLTEHSPEQGTPIKRNMLAPSK